MFKCLHFHWLFETLLKLTEVHGKASIMCMQHSTNTCLKWMLVTELQHVLYICNSVIYVYLAC